MASKSGLWRSRARADGPKSRPGGTPRGAPRCLSENLGHPRRPRGVGLSPPVRWGGNVGRETYKLGLSRTCTAVVHRLICGKFKFDLHNGSGRVMVETLGTCS